MGQREAIDSTIACAATAASRRVHMETRVVEQTAARHLLSAPAKQPSMG